jgi:hypothetical protein
MMGTEMDPGVIRSDPDDGGTDGPWWDQIRS